MSTKEHIDRMALQSWPHYNPMISDDDNRRIQAISQAVMQLPRALAMHNQYALDEIESYVVLALTMQINQTKPANL